MISNEVSTLCQLVWNGAECIHGMRIWGQKVKKWHEMKKVNYLVYLLFLHRIALESKNPIHINTWVNIFIDLCLQLQNMNIKGGTWIEFLK